MSFPSREQKNLKHGQNAQSWAHMLNQGRLHPRLVVIVPLDSYHWILQPNISRFTWRKCRNFPLESCKGKKMAKMLVMGPICSIRAACCPWSAQKSSFLTSQIDSTVWKTLHMYSGIAFDNFMVFCYLLMLNFLIRKWKPRFSWICQKVEDRLQLFSR